jgi:hypothetical protein
MERRQKIERLEFDIEDTHRRIDKANKVIVDHDEILHGPTSRLTNGIQWLPNDGLITRVNNNEKDLKCYIRNLDLLMQHLGLDFVDLKAERVVTKRED